MTLLPLLNDLFDVGLGHLFADVPVDDGPAGAVEDGAQIVEGAGDVEVRDVDVPVLVGSEGLHESGSFQAGFGLPALEKTGLGEDAIDGGGGAGNDVAVDHHEGEASVAFEFMGLEEHAVPGQAMLESVHGGASFASEAGLGGGVGEVQFDGGAGVWVRGSGFVDGLAYFGSHFVAFRLRG